MELSAGFVKTSGRILSWKGPKLGEELGGISNAIETLGLRHVETHSYKLSETMSEFNIAVFEKLKKTSPIYPREYKTIKKSPL